VLQGNDMINAIFSQTAHSMVSVYLQTRRFDNTRTAVHVPDPLRSQKIRFTTHMSFLMPKQ